jgi:type I restriction enzyme S subunit
MKRYPEYKASGGKWLDALPEHWEVKRIKHCSRIRYGIGEPPEYVDDGVPLIRATNVNAGKIESTNLVQVDPNDIPSKRIVWLKAGDIIVVRSGAYTGDSSIVPKEYEGSIAGFDMVLSVTNGNPGFVAYSLLSKYLRDGQIYLEKLRAAQPHLNAEELGNCFILLPPLSEQEIIASFLDCETTRIDSLIDKKQRLLDLLKEKRTALISRAVTKGLDANVKMKPSGVEWLGEIPAHWAVKKLKYIKAQIPNAFVDGPFGSNLKTEHFTTDGDAFVIESNFATRGVLSEEELKQISASHFETIKRSATKEGDIIIAKIGAYFGLNNILPKLSMPAVVSGNSLKLTVNSDKCDVMYAHYHLLFLKWCGAIELLVNATAQPALSLGDMNSLSFLLPPLAEQNKISTYINRETAKLDQLTAKVQSAIVKLKEYRTALISAAVTGKIDVSTSLTTGVREGA